MCMDNFIFKFKKEIYSSKPLTKEQLKSVHASFVGLGYPKNYQDFYAELSEYCEPHLGEATTLFSKEAKPFIAKKLVDLLESLTQADAESKIFGLCTLERKCKVPLKIPAIRVNWVDAMKIVRDARPDLEDFLYDTIEESVTVYGFADPVEHLSFSFSQNLYPKKEKVLDVRIGTSTKEKRNSVGAIEFEEYISKVSLTVKIGRHVYESILYQDLENVRMMQTSCHPVEDVYIQTEKPQVLSVADYEMLRRPERHLDYKISK